MTRSKDADALDAAESGESDIDERDPRRVGRDSIERCFHRTVNVTALEAFGAVDQIGEPFASLLLVLDDRHTDDSSTAIQCKA